MINKRPVVNWKEVAKRGFEILKEKHPNSALTFAKYKSALVVTFTEIRKEFVKPYPCKCILKRLFTWKNYRHCRAIWDIYYDGIPVGYKSNKFRRNRDKNLTLYKLCKKRHPEKTFCHYMLK